MTKPTLWFAGTPLFAAHALTTLIENQQYHIAGVLTQPDRPAGRGRKIQMSAVKQVALNHQLPVEQPSKLTENPFPDFAQPDLIIVAAYGLLLPQWFLDIPRLGCLNIHASLLPRWRGAAPIQRAIEAGDTESGVGIMQMDAGLDTGAVWLEKRTPITDTTTAQELHDTLMQLGSEALLEALPLVLSEQQRPTPQPTTGITYAHKLTKQEAAINWQEDAYTIVRKIRAFSGYPVAHTQLNGETIRIHQAIALSETAQAPSGTVISHHAEGIDVATKEGTVRLIQLQFPSKTITTAAQLKNSRDLTGQQFL
ncbi:Methionyl-tRNA formyltransferase [Suttonella ornithocola]|uniref:Methionyl-tRNA formyltransferase n=2 Tax=Suttonella ornithocola TaxID=279832 RepID=A0A380MPP7_9GAMM|nr:methionyl-tRNA formyltransferase [Suttonella ornithocola]SUO94565.1 Methionyl-tRNA formyltransferase [Suttonella ornithocola]